MTIPTEIEVEVFRAGDYGERGVYTEDDLTAIAVDYAADAHEAPVTIDHAQNGPAHGWVSGLKCLGGRLIASLSRLSPNLAEALRSGSFRKRSIELYRQFEKTGRPYLKAVSFLGAAAPAVKGLADPIFADPGADTQTIIFEEDPPRDSAFAETARAELIRRGCWKPEWESAGLLAVFQALGNGRDSECLFNILQATGTPVTFGETPRRLSTETARFAEDLIGGASDESRDRHAAALDMMNADPDLNYRDALLHLR